MIGRLGEAYRGSIRVSEEVVSRQIARRPAGCQSEKDHNYLGGFKLIMIPFFGSQWISSWELHPNLGVGDNYDLR